MGESNSPQAGHCQSLPPAVAVVGGGIAGMQAALDLAQAGFRVILIEQSPAIGGRMVQLDKTFPTNDCSMCTISPRLVEIERHPNIRLLTGTEVLGLEGGAGHFRLRVRRQPRFVDISRCNSCGDCTSACPIDLPSIFEAGLGTRKAVDKLYPQAVPGAVAIAKKGISPCRQACPAGVNVQGYVALAAKGRWAEAYALIRQRNPFVSVCGRICHHPCEESCHRGKLDQPVAIRAIKRTIADWVAKRRLEGEDPVPPERGMIDRAKPRIAIVGGGPAGLTAARDLALRGYPVTVFEESDRLGGMLQLALPEFRLSQAAFAGDLKDILASGFETRLKWRLGREGTLETLRREGYAAVLLATGCPYPATLHLSVEGDLASSSSDLAGGRQEVLYALELLRLVRAGRTISLPGRVVVIGGGNVAIDVARMARRLGAHDVELVCLESRQEMPAYPWEIEHALLEGVNISPGWGPYRWVVSGGKLRGVLFRRCSCVFDQAGRFAPSFGEDTYFAAADWVIVAIGQRAEYAHLGLLPGMLLSDGRLAVDPGTLQTPIGWVFAAGDAVTGPRSVVEAVAQGHRAAESIDRWLRGKELSPTDNDRPMEAVPFPERPVRRKERVRLPHRVWAGPGDFGETEQTLPAELASAEAQRCLACADCSECGACVRACSAGAIIHEMIPEETTLDVAAVILAPGIELLPGEVRPEFGFGRFANVITSLQMERLLSASGPTGGHVYRPSDHCVPRRVAWLLCVGSRDSNGGVPYCSSVCCMYAVKQAIVAAEHHPELEAVIFYNDLRAYGKGFEAFVARAKATGRIHFRRGLVSAVKENPQSANLVVHCVDGNGRPIKEEFELVVLAVGLRPSATGEDVARRLGVELDPWGFAAATAARPVSTNRSGIFVAGAFAGPMDIPEAVTSGSGAAAAVMALMGPEERVPAPPVAGLAPLAVGNDSTGQPRIGVFVCRCGANIARVIDVKQLVEYARQLPKVVYAEENVYTCSTDTQLRIKELVAQWGINRVVVASCTPRTHEPLFRQTLREAGLNPYLFEMANIRDQCSWVHFDDPQAATEKAKALVRMAVARAARLRPIPEITIPVEPSVLVIGGGVAGLAASESLAGQGFRVILVEKSLQLGGKARSLGFLPDGSAALSLVEELIAAVHARKNVHILLEATVEEVSGHVGQFQAVVNHAGCRKEFRVGAIVVACGAEIYRPKEFGYGHNPQVVTQHELEAKLLRKAISRDIRRIVMIQCVGSRSPARPYCSRVCCIQAVKNALLLRRLAPWVSVVIVHRDIRTYGQYELLYKEAREQGVLFLRQDDSRPVELREGDRLQVVVDEVSLGRRVAVGADLLVLSVGMEPGETNPQVAQMLKVPLGSDGFFLEAHAKLRPVEFASEGIFLAGLAQGPKLVTESIRQALAVAGRVGALLSQGVLVRAAATAQVDPLRCATCLTCVRLCPFEVPKVGLRGVVEIDPLSCHGCGVCAAHCPRKAIQLEHFRDEQLAAKLEALLPCTV
ncbi:MAG: FAD-dependent oxidoreductase [Thermoguttaceae bacterium]|nr:FAD-dependent oxidoreductase [Thermoguttaceae bacterium]